MPTPSTVAVQPAAAPAPAAPIVAELTTLGGFRLLQRLGRGSMGEVYLAHDPVLDRQVAIKVLLLAELAHLGQATLTALRQRFLREARLAARIVHPHIVRVLTANEERGQPYLVMDYVPGPLLRQVLEEEALPVATALAITTQLAQALQYAWAAHGVIHRDLKPENLILPASHQVTLLDLGLAKALGDANAGPLLSLAGEPMGSLIYMSPEQHRGEPNVDFRTDIFALGEVLYEMLTQRPPYLGQHEADLYTAKIAGPATALAMLDASIPAAVRGLLAQMLDPRPEHRAASYDDLLVALHRASLGIGGAGARPGPALRPAPVAAPAPAPPPAAVWVAGRATRVAGVPAVTAGPARGVSINPLAPISAVPSAAELEAATSGWRHQAPTLVPGAAPAEAPANPHTATLVPGAAGGQVALPAAGDPHAATLVPSAIVPPPVDAAAPRAAAPPVFLPALRELLEDVQRRQMVGPYYLERLIGIGGMGCVYSARHASTGEPVALKVLIPRLDEGMDVRLWRFRREGQLIGRLDHPAIVKLRDTLEDAGLHVLVTELYLAVGGEPMNLQDYARLGGNAAGLIEAEDMQQVALTLLEALAYSHEHQVVHCDLKPANVLFQYVADDEPGFWRAHLKLTDFGLAKVVGEDLVRRSVNQSMSCFGAAPGEAPMDAQALLGTYDYMSPEQRRGEPATAQSDLFAVGMILLRLLTGARELGLRGRPSKLRPGLATAWDEVILTALREKPEQRYPTATAMHAALAALAG